MNFSEKTIQYEDIPVLRMQGDIEKRKGTVRGRTAKAAEE